LHLINTLIAMNSVSRIFLIFSKIILVIQKTTFPSISQKYNYKDQNRIMNFPNFEDTKNEKNMHLTVAKLKWNL